LLAASLQNQERMALSDITASAIGQAIAEFDHLGQAGFHNKYGFGEARGYFLIEDGKRYPSKAIVGAAHGYLPGKSPLVKDQFSGGRARVKRRVQGWRGGGRACGACAQRRGSP
jgi:5-methylcytosine-specific restriction enzyme A